MAELHVQTKKHNSSGSMWLWIVLALVIAGAIIYYLTTRNKAGNTPPPPDTSSRGHHSANPLDIENILDGQDVTAVYC